MKEGIWQRRNGGTGEWKGEERVEGEVSGG